MFSGKQLKTRRDGVKKNSHRMEVFVSTVAKNGSL